MGSVTVNAKTMHMCEALFLSLSREGVPVAEPTNLPIQIILLPSYMTPTPHMFPSIAG